jgi:KDO2-lipid IV(A) lauroyltransferase
MWLISLLPLRVLYVFSKFLYFLIFYVIGYRKKVVYENLSKSFPNKSKEEIDEIARKFYKYFSRLIVEIVKLTSISPSELENRIKYKNPEIFEELFKQGKNVAIITAHYGNWEWLTGVCEATPHRIMSVYKPLSNKFLNKHFIKLRSRFGAELVPMASIIRAIIKLRNENITSATLFISDQSPMRHLIQYWTEFLNQDTPVFLGPAKIAMQTKQAVVFCKVLPLKLGYYEVELVKLFDDASNYSEKEITEAHVRELEKQIIEKPEYWLWTHRRWKHSRSPLTN